MKLLFLCFDRAPPRLPDEMISLIVYFATYLPVTDKTIRHLVKRWGEGFFTEEERQKFGHISDWDVSQVTNMSYLFYCITVFNEPLESWNVDQVKNMSWMFCNATVFNQPLSSWNVGQVTNMRWMFYDARAFNQPPSWKVPENTSTYQIFVGTQIN